MNKHTGPRVPSLIIKHPGYSGTAMVSLTRGLWALIDESDVPIISPYKWRATSELYAQRCEKRRSIGMHRFIAGDSAPHVDHKNSNTLDNRRTNLRPATTSQNLANRSAVRPHGRKWKGVYPRNGKWGSSINTKGKQFWLGTYATAEEAARAYDRKAPELFGEFTRLNFPRE